MWLLTINRYLGSEDADPDKLFYSVSDTFVEEVMQMTEYNKRQATISLCLNGGERYSDPVDPDMDFEDDLEYSYLLFDAQRVTPNEVKTLEKFEVLKGNFTIKEIP